MGRFFKQTIHDVDIRHRTVLVRVDYNVPLTHDGQVADDLRIRASWPTVQYLLQQGCKVVLISHLGRPHGRDARLSLSVVAEYISRVLHQPIQFIRDCVGDEVRQAVRRAPRGSLLLLENLRFYAEEEADDTVFARAIAKATEADYFVQDGFAVVHRSHASTHAITLYIPSLAGDLLQREYTMLWQVMARPSRPCVAVIGGAKVSDKMALIRRLIDRADTILLGGAMATTFLRQDGLPIGRSLAEDESDRVASIYAAAKQKVGQVQYRQLLRLPRDVAVGADPQSDEPRREVPVDAVGTDEMILDIGAQTIKQFSDILSRARTIIWNGPLGVATNPQYAVGSAAIAQAINANHQAVSVIGGGDTAEFIAQWAKDQQRPPRVTHISTGGGASLALLSGQRLPGVDSLLDAHGLRCYTKA